MLCRVEGVASGSEQMRIFLVCFTLPLMGLAISPAAAYPMDYEGYGYYAPYHRYHPRYYHPLYTSRVIHYESCSCHFGYEGGYSMRTPTVSCYAEGGRCRATYPAQAGN
jgi:hypothetical protein